MKRRLLAVPLPFLLLALAGCAGGTAEARSALVRDSAGIQIVENEVPLWQAGEGWRLDGPALSIGELEGAEEYQLHQVRAAARLADGRIVVANAGTHQLRFYDADGRFLRAAGSQGGGPGEFQAMADLFVDDGHIYVNDLRERRISVFDLEGNFLRAFPLSGGEGAPFLRVVGRFSDGSWLVSAMGMGMRGGSGPPPSGLVRDSVTYFRLREGAESLDTIGRFPGTESFINSGDGGGGTRFVAIMNLPYGRRPTMLVDRDRLIFGDSYTYQIGVYDGAGSLQRLVRKPFTPEPVTDDDIRALQDAEPRRETFGGPGPSPAMPNPAELPRPEAKAAYGAFLNDREGNLWVPGPPRPGDNPTEWDVFSPEGQWLGTVTTPARFRVLEIGADHLLGVFRDDLDVEYVQMYRLIKA